MEKIDIDKIRNLPIESVATRLGLTVHKHKSLCPFHQDSHPSLTYNVKKNTYRCFVCDAHGGVIDLAMNFLHLNFKEACKWLADSSNIIITEYKSPKPYTLSPKPQTVDIRHLSMLVATPVLNAEARKFLFDERKLEPEVIEKLGISSISCPVPMSGDLNGSWFNAPSLLIPYKDLDGNLLSVQARYLGDKGVGCRDEGGGNSLNPKPYSLNLPRFQFPKGSHCSIFNLPALKNAPPEEPVFVTEGVSDCLAMLSAGFTSIAIPSATLLKPDDVKLLQGRKLHMYPDRDAPGERLFLDLKELVETPSSLNPNPSTLTRHQLREGFKDIGQYYAYIKR